MEGQNLTASAVITFCGQLEDRSAAFYEELAARFAQREGAFLGFAKDSKKNKVWVTRTYQETISDALEACFCFQGLRLQDFDFKPVLIEDADFSDALATAIEVEERAASFYIDVAKRSESLLATIPGAFRRVAKTRNARKARLESMLKEAKAGT